MTVRLRIFPGILTLLSLTASPANSCWADGLKLDCRLRCRQSPSSGHFRCCHTPLGTECTTWRLLPPGLGDYQPWLPRVSRTFCSSCRAAAPPAPTGIGIAAAGILNPAGTMRLLLPAVMAGVLGIYGLIVGSILAGKSMCRAPVAHAASAHSTHPRCYLHPPSPRPQSPHLMQLDTTRTLHSKATRICPVACVSAWPLWLLAWRLAWWAMPVCAPSASSQSCSHPSC